MFEKLGYEKSEVIDPNEYVAFINIDDESELIFNLKKKTLQKQYLNSAVVKKITLEEMIIIVKLYKELGWLDER